MSGFDAWKRAEPLLDELLELDATARATRLSEVETTDPTLAAQVRGMLSAADTEVLPSLGSEAVAALLGAAEEPIPSRIGERVGAFRITAELGRGGMGAVFAAERVDGGFQQQVAIKVLKRGTDSDHVVRRFLAERQILARLEHPHIARLVDGGVTGDGLPWFALERVEGRSITEHVQRAGLPLAERLRLFADVCEAVAFAHGHRIVHRDIKPSNVFVSASGEVKLLDFGIAKLLDPSEERLTRTNVIVMTPRYAAPEQRAAKEVTTATDVWQLGLLLREMLPAPLPRELETLAARASHDEPSRRYPSAGPLAEDVRRFLGGQPVLARPDPLGYRLARFVRRRALPLGATSLALLAIAAWALTRRSPHFSAAPLRFQLVSTFPGSHRQASFSPDGQSIAFLMEDADGTPQVWTKTLAGGDPVKRTSDPRSAHRPRWSPAGDVILYDVPGQGIWSVPAAGGEARRIREDGFNPNISPDGRQIVYEVDAYLWAARIDGSGAHRIGEGGRSTLEKEYAFVESTPAFSPDGREVVYFQDRDGPVFGDLWSAPLAGGEPKQLTFDAVNTSHPVWMPDGSGIVYTSSRRGGLTLWFRPAAGGEPRALTTGTGEDREAAVSRDGRRLIYTNARNLIRLMWLDPRSGEKRQLLENRAVVTHPAFSPDGRQLAVFQGESRDLQLWTVKNDGSEPRQITFGEKNRSIVPEWSRNGRFLYHYLFPGGGFSRTPAHGGATEVLIPSWTHSVQHGAHVSPDERRVVYTELAHARAVATRVRDLTTGAEHALAEPIVWPRWSPDGTAIVGHGRERELVLCPPTGEACKGLGLEGTEPRWSADGHIYFVRYSGYQGSRDPKSVPVFRIGRDGKGLTKIAELEGPSPVNFFYDVSPTGELAWASFVPGRQELWMADLQPQSK